MSERKKLVVVVTNGGNDERSSVAWSVANGGLGMGFEVTMFLVSSGVDWVTNTGGLLSLAVTPLFWNPNWDFHDCTSSGCDDPALRAVMREHIEDPLSLELLERGSDEPIIVTVDDDQIVFARPVPMI